MAVETASSPVGVTGSSSGSSGTSAASPAPTSGTSTAQAPAGASSSAVSAVGDSSNPEASNPLYPRFKDVNDKYSALKWADGLDQDRTRKALALAEWAESDPRGFYEYYGSQLRSNGLIPAEQVRAAVRSQGGNGQGIPGPDFRDPATGATFYSAERLNQVLEQFEQRLTQRVAPLANSLGTIQVQARARSEAQSILAQAERWAHFGEYKGQILNAMASNPRLSLPEAYIQVVVPQLGQAERQTFASELQAKPGATTVNPGGMAPAAGEKLSELPIKNLLSRAFKARGIAK